MRRDEKKSTSHERAEEENQQDMALLDPSRSLDAVDE
jgi:hypothetical protein